MENFRMSGGATRFELSSTERIDVLRKCILVNIFPIFEDGAAKPTPMLALEYLCSILDPLANLIEGVLVLPDGEDHAALLLVANSPGLVDTVEPRDLLFEKFKWEEPVTLKATIAGESLKLKATSKAFKYAIIMDSLPDKGTEINSNLDAALVTGSAIAEGYRWLPSSGKLLSSTPRPDPKKWVSVSEFKEMMDMVKELKVELATYRDKGKPPLDTSKELAQSLAECSKDIIQSLGKEGFLSSTHCKLEAKFSAEGMKGDATYESWEFEVQGLVKNKYPEAQIIQAMIKSLRGNAAEAFRAMDFTNLKVADILSEMRKKFGLSSTFDTMMSNFYSANQEMEETVSHFSTRIESILRDIKIRFPEKISDEVRADHLRDRFFQGCRDSIRNAIMFKYKNPEEKYTDLLGLAREVEEAENRRKASGAIPKTVEKKTQIKSEIVGIPSQVKVHQLLQQCTAEQATNTNTIKSLQNALKDFEQRNNPHHVPYDQRPQNSQNQGQRNGAGRGYTNQGFNQGNFGRGAQPNYYNPNPNYLGHNYIPGFRGRGGSGRGGPGRGAPRPNQSQNYQYYQSIVNQAQNPENPPAQLNATGGEVNPQNQNQVNPNGGQNQNGQNNYGQNNGRGGQGRRPYCKYCANAGFPSTDHWSSQCEFVDFVTRQWRQGQQASGHQNQSGSLNGSELP